ncbi:17715_t:CDS:2, partial [Rhizophagus irregularis]
MSIAKTSIQIAITEGVTAELIGILTQFIMKYRRSTSLSIENKKPDDVTVQKTCSYCSGKDCNIHGCPKYKAESSANKENVVLHCW